MKAINTMFASMCGQARALVLFLLFLYLPPLVVLSVVVVASSTTGVSPAAFLRDPTALMGAHPFTGSVSNLGILVWCASAAICLFSWSILRHRPTMASFSQFLLYSGLFTILLLLDDFFLFHEEIFPKFNVKQNITFTGYGVLLVCLIMVFKESILKTEYLFLFFALCFFGFSLGIDIFSYRVGLLIGGWRILFEDGFKFLGIMSWFGYFFRCCFVAANETRIRDTS